MSTLRGPSAEDRHHHSPIPNDCQTANEELLATRKCCTLCNLLVCYFYRLYILERKFFFSFFQLNSDLHLQTHLRGTRHNKLLFERFHPKKPSQDELVNNSKLFSLHKQKNNK
jgi:hypothetical protein